MLLRSNRFARKSRQLFRVLAPNSSLTRCHGVYVVASLAYFIEFQACDLKQNVQAHYTNTRAMPLFPNSIIFPLNPQQSQTSFAPIQRVLSPSAEHALQTIRTFPHIQLGRALRVYASSHCAETYILANLRLQHNQQPHERPNRG